MIIFIEKTSINANIFRIIPVWNFFIFRGSKLIRGVVILFCLLMKRIRNMIPVIMLVMDSMIFLEKIVEIPYNKPIKVRLMYVIER